MRVLLVLHVEICGMLFLPCALLSTCIPPAGVHLLLTRLDRPRQLLKLNNNPIFVPHSALHKDYPLVCRWFISLARRDQFTSAVWKASDDIGFDAFHDFVQGTGKTQVVAPAGKIGEEEVPQTKGKGQKVHVKPSKPAAGSKFSSQQQVPKKATTTESTVSLYFRSLSFSLSLLFSSFFSLLSL